MHAYEYYQTEMMAAWVFSGEKIELSEKLFNSKIFELLVVFAKCNNMSNFQYSTVVFFDSSLTKTN